MRFNKDGKYFISMPGVPCEMKAIMSSLVLPEFQSKFVAGVFLHKTILTQGVPESVLAELLENWQSSLHPDVKLAYLPSESRVRLRLSIKGVDKKKLNEILASHSGQKVEKIVKDSDRDNFMSPDQAVKYGLIDAVVDSRSAKK